MVYNQKKEVVLPKKGNQPIVAMPPRPVQQELIRLLGARGVGLNFGEDAGRRPIITLSIGGLHSPDSLEAARTTFDDLLAECLADHTAGMLCTARVIHYLS